MKSAPNIWYILKDIYEESIVAIISLKKAHLAQCSKSHPQRRCFPTNRASPLICYSLTFRPATAPLLNGSHFFLMNLLKKCRSYSEFLIRFQKYYFWLEKNLWSIKIVRYNWSISKGFWLFWMKMKAEMLCGRSCVAFLANSSEKGGSRCGGTGSRYV